MEDVPFLLDPCVHVPLHYQVSLKCHAHMWNWMKASLFCERAGGQVFFVRTSSNIFLIKGKQTQLKNITSPEITIIIFEPKYISTKSAALNQLKKIDTCEWEAPTPILKFHFENTKRTFLHLMGSELAVLAGLADPVRQPV